MKNTLIALLTMVIIICSMHGLNKLWEADDIRSCTEYTSPQQPKGCAEFLDSIKYKGE